MISKVNLTANKVMSQPPSRVSMYQAMNNSTLYQNTNNNLESGGSINSPMTPIALSSVLSPVVVKRKPMLESFAGEEESFLSVKKVVSRPKI